MKMLKRLGRGKRDRKLFVIGLDCAAPELVFDLWRDDLPNLSYLADHGLWGDLQSCIPAITVPAWSCMLSGRDPGELGLYGFRNRADHSYDKMFIALGSSMPVKRVWDYVSDVGKTSVVVGVPQTFPVKPLNGHLVSGFLTPTIDNDFTHPASLKQEVLSIVPEYDFDVPKFRTDDKDWLRRQIWEMTEKHFKVIDHLLATKPWDFFMLMEIGVDRIHHGFWSYMDPKHHRYEAGNPYEDVIHDYYVYIDEKIGDWLNKIGKDTAVLVVSDHGAKRMDGGICINEWLWREGYLAFVNDPVPGEILPFEKMEVDWSRTRAWGSGGYYGRVFLNVKGREPQGVISGDSYEAVRDELADKIRAIPDPAGKTIGTRVFKPQEIYRTVRGVPPDLMVYFGDLHWRSVGSLGYEAAHTFENDIGPDDCNHAQNGLFILYDPRNEWKGHEIKDADLVDVTKTILGLLDIPFPQDLQGRNLTHIDD